MTKSPDTGRRRGRSVSHLVITASIFPSYFRAERVGPDGVEDLYLDITQSRRMRTDSLLVYRKKRPN